jgi:hypothetical protein
MGPTEFHQTLGSLNLAQQRVAALFDVSPRAVRRWRDGERRVPCGVDIVVHLLAAGAVTIDQVERAAVHRTNGGAAPSAPLPVQAVTVDLVEQVGAARMNAEPPVVEPAAPLLLEPPSEVVTDLAEVALSADPVIVELTLGEKVAALTSRSCHWPIGDPQHSDFRFCGEATKIPPYCAEHRALAYMPPLPRPVRRKRLYSARAG